jgi:hypothetical protein
MLRAIIVSQRKTLQRCSQTLTLVKYYSSTHYAFYSRLVRSSDKLCDVLCHFPEEP